MKKYIILPTYNEKENISKILEAIFNLNIVDLHVVVVDDNSLDGTGKIVDDLISVYGDDRLGVIHRKGKLGLGSAYIEGFKKAFLEGADLVFEMDADFSHNPKDIPRLIEEIINGNDVVIGSRRIKGGSVKGWGFRRNFQSKCAMAFARFILGLKTRDITAGFRCFRTEAIKKINLDKIGSNGYAFQEELIYLCEKKNFRIKEIPVVFVDREHGKSKLSTGDIFEFFTTVIKLRFSK